MIIVLLVSLFLVACSNNETEEESKITSEHRIETEFEKVEIFKVDMITSFDTKIEEPEYAINDEDFNKYHTIMNYLHQYPEKEESVLLKELGNSLGESPEEIMEFMNIHQVNAIQRDQGKTKNDVKVEEIDIKKEIKRFFTQNVKEKDLLEFNLDSMIMEFEDKVLVTKGNFIYDFIEYEYRIKSGLSIDYQKINTLELIVNNTVIDLGFELN